MTVMIKLLSYIMTIKNYLELNSSYRGFYVKHFDYVDAGIVAERSKAVLSGSILNWRGFESRRCQHTFDMKGTITQEKGKIIIKHRQLCGRTTSNLMQCNT